MDNKYYGDTRWKIFIGNYDGVEKTAVDRLYGFVQNYLPYILTVHQADENWLEELKNGQKLLVIGTLENQPVLQQLADEGLYETESSPEGFCIQTIRYLDAEENNIIVLQGADAAGVLYAVSDFIRFFILGKERYSNFTFNAKYPVFIDPIHDFTRRSRPSIEYRGIWTWGHVINDIERYFSHMSYHKLNIVVLWNDVVPINAKEIIDLAKSYNIKVIWGYTWSWGEDVDPANEDHVKLWQDRVLEIYETQYKDLNVDGIYFQSFTETSDQQMGEYSIATLAKDWADKLTQPLYEKYPDLWIQFGVHHTSITDQYQEFQSLDPRMTINWEDLDSFPYTYNSSTYDEKTQEEFLNRHNKLLHLRGEKERFAAVWKGFTVLNWSKFEHQKGRFILGHGNKVALKKKMDEQSFYWNYLEPYWFTQVKALQTISKQIAQADIKDRCILALVEDGAYECVAAKSVGLYAECLWDPNQDEKELVEAILHDDYSI